ncbi:MAG: hypothetical protein U7123_00485 [Potamolinea sp.]
MSNRFCFFSFWQKNKPIYARSKLAVMLLILALCISCSPAKPPNTALTISVQPASNPGLYTVSGTTNLPNKSQITVAAIRYLRPKSQEFFSSDPQETYAILARQIVNVSQGKWQANLNLWQIATDGRLQEAWQVNQSQTGLLLNPANEVSFVVTFDPAGQFLNPEQQQVQFQDLKGSLVRFTNEGFPYVQAIQNLKIALPVGRRPPPIVKDEDLNGGWGKRYEIKPERPVANNMRPQPIKTNQSNAPLSASEFVR